MMAFQELMRKLEEVVYLLNMINTKLGVASDEKSEKETPKKFYPPITIEDYD